MRSALTAIILIACIDSVKASSIPQPWTGDWALSNGASQNGSANIPKLLKISANSAGVLIQGDPITAPDGFSTERFFVTVDGKPMLLSDRCEISVARVQASGFVLQILYRDGPRTIQVERHRFTFAPDGETLMETRTGGQATVLVFQKIWIPPAGPIQFRPAVVLRCLPPSCRADWQSAAD
jgi:hypothetical protein